MAQSAVVPTDHHLYWVILVGQAPGVYLGRHRGEAALGPFAAAKFITADTLADANALFVSDYMKRAIVRLSE